MFTYVETPFYYISTPAAVFVASTRAKLKSFVVQVAGTAGNLVLNDCATLAQASAANQICTIPYNMAGSPTQPWPGEFNWPLQSGLVVSAVPTGFVFAVSIEYLVP